MSAAIEIPAEAYVVGVWHFEFPERLSEFGKGGNYLAILYSTDPQRLEWELMYRFRHYRDLETVWESNDTFHSYLVKAEGGEATVKAGINKVVQIAAGIAGGALVDYSDVRGDGELAFNRISNLPWFHTKAEVAS